MACWQSVRQYFERGIPDGFFKNVAWQYLSNIWAIGLGFLYSLLIGRALGAAEFGLISLGLGFAGLIFGVLELRLHEAVIRYIAEFWEQNDYRRTLAIVKLSLLVDASTGTLALVVALITAPLAQEYLIRDPRGLIVVWLSALSVFFINVGNRTAIGLLRVFEQFKLYALVIMAGTTLKLIVTLGAILLMGWGAIGVMIVTVLTSLLTNLALVGMALWQLNRRIPLRQTQAPMSVLWPRLREMSRFVLNTYGLSLASIPTRDLDVNLLGWFTSLKVVGIYKIAKNFMAAIWQISDPAFYVIYPELSKLWSKKQFATLKTFIKKLIILLGGTGVLLFSGTFVLVPRGIQWMMGSEFAEAGTIFQWMVWSLLFWMPFLWVNPLLMAAGLPNLSLRAALMSNLLTLGLYLIWIPIWGGQGAALAYGMGVPLNLGIAIHLGRRAGVIFPSN